MLYPFNIVQCLFRLQMQLTFPANAFTRPQWHAIAICSYPVLWLCKLMDLMILIPGLQVHNMTIRAKGKILLEHAHLSITAGRRYGLVGPNGKGKSTLLRMVARRQIPVPENLDVLLVEQVRFSLVSPAPIYNLVQSALSCSPCRSI